jgi:hypothetical protein
LIHRLISVAFFEPRIDRRCRALLTLQVHVLLLVKMRKQKNVDQSSKRERTPFQDITQESANKNNGAKQGSGKKLSWYARLSPEAKQEHLKKLRIAREQKKTQLQALVNLSSNFII